MKSLVTMLKALGETNRLRICMMLLEKPLCVCELLSVLDIAGGTLSNHLKVLWNAGLVEQRKDGKWVEYYIAHDRAEQFIRNAASFLTETSQFDRDRKEIINSSRERCSIS